MARRSPRAVTWHSIRGAAAEYSQAHGQVYDSWPRVLFPKCVNSRGTRTIVTRTTVSRLLVSAGLISGTCKKEGFAA